MLGPAHQIVPAHFLGHELESASGGGDLGLELLPPAASSRSAARS